MPTASRSRLLRSFLFLFLVLLPAAAHAQACFVTSSMAPDAAGNSMPIWSCDQGPEVTNHYTPPPEPDVFGAIAVATNLDWGTAWNFKSEDAAKAEALRRCKVASHRIDCKIAVSVADVCVSLSLSKINRLYAIGGPTGAVNYAEVNSNLHCQRAGGKACVIAASFCADGIRHFTPMTDSPAVPFGRTRRR